jgi:hypothetical protein
MGSASSWGSSPASLPLLLRAGAGRRSGGTGLGRKWRRPRASFPERPATARVGGCGTRMRGARALAERAGAGRVGAGGARWSGARGSWRHWSGHGSGGRSRRGAGQGCTRLGRAQERRGKDGASVGPATGGGGGVAV